MTQLLAILLILAAIVLGLGGFNYLTQATLGVGFLASACLLAILARIAQADAHHREALEEAKTRQTQTLNLLQLLYTVQTGSELERRTLIPGTTVTINARAMDRKNKRVELLSAPDPESDRSLLLSHGQYVNVVKDPGGEYVHIETLDGKHDGWLDHGYIKKRG